MRRKTGDEQGPYFALCPKLSRGVFCLCVSVPPTVLRTCSHPLGGGVCFANLWLCLVRLIQHREHLGCLLDFAPEPELSRPKPLGLACALLSILVVLHAPVRQRIPLALARVDRGRHVVHVLEVPPQVAVLVLARLKGLVAHGAEQQLSCGLVVGG